MARVSPDDLEEAARRQLEPAIFDFFAGGAEAEVTLNENLAAFQALRLAPPVLRGAGPPDLAIELLGAQLSMPLVIAPTAFHRLAHPDGERGSARAASTAGIVMVISMAATEPIEVVAAACAGHAWFQLYLQPDLGFTQALVRRAEAAGCSALVVTVDSPVFGARRRDLRNGFTDLPDGFCCENMRDPDTGAVRPIVFSTALSWREIEWLRSITDLPIVLKGVVRADDALHAIRCGVGAIYVSNHGGRQLDETAPTAALLPAVADAVAGAAPVLVDGGIRSGTDVLKALALGATAVAVGRPVIWGLAEGGAPGAAAVLERIRRELERSLALCGCASPERVDRSLIWRPA